MASDEILHQAEEQIHTLQLENARLRDTLARHGISLSSAEDTKAGASVNIAVDQPPETHPGQLADLRMFAGSAMDTIRELLLVLDEHCQVLFANRAFLYLFQLTADETLGHEFFLLANGQWDIPELHALLEHTLSQGQSVENYELQHHFTSIGTRTMRLNACRISAQVSATPVMVFAIEDITLQREVQNSLTESETLFRTLAENAPAFIGLVQGRIFRYVNPAFVLASGFSVEELLDKDICEVIDPEEHDLLLHRLALMERREAVPEHHEYRLVTKEGEIVWVDLIAAPVTYHGQPAVMGVAFDITARKRVEAALQESETLFRTLAEHATAVIGIVQNEKFIYANPYLSEISGYSNDEILAMDFKEMVHPDDREMIVERARQRQLGEPQPSHYEFKMVTRSGAVRWMDFSVARVEFHGAPAAVGVAYDITERRHVEEEHERIVAELNATITSIADALVVYNTAEDIVRTNPAADYILGFTPQTPDEILNKHWIIQHAETPEGQAILPDDLPHNKALLGDEVRGVMIMYHRTPSETLWLCISAGPIRMPDGKIVGAVATFTDITPMHEMQEQRDIFMHTVSHDLRLPITTVHGYAQLMRDYLTQQHLDGELLSGMDIILRNVRRLNTMIQDLVMVTRLEGGQLILRREPIALAAYLDELLHSLAPAVDTTRVSIEIPAALPPVYADPDRLERILTNLITNALKYSPEATPVVISAVQRQDEVAISVRDQGRGIPPADTTHLFKRFYRVAGTKGAEGIGLGLYIARMLVDAHGGHIWVESVVSKGSTFTFTMPIALARKAAA